MSRFNVNIFNYDRYKEDTETANRVNLADLRTITVAHIIRWSFADSGFKKQYAAFCNTYTSLVEATLDDSSLRFALRHFNKRTANTVAEVCNQHAFAVRAERIEAELLKAEAINAARAIKEEEEEETAPDTIAIADTLEPLTDAECDDIRNRFRSEPIIMRHSRTFYYDGEFHRYQPDGDIQWLKVQVLLERGDGKCSILAYPDWSSADQNHIMIATADKRTVYQCTGTTQGKLTYAVLGSEMYYKLDGSNLVSRDTNEKVSFEVYKGGLNYMSREMAACKVNALKAKAAEPITPLTKQEVESCLQLGWKVYAYSRVAYDYGKFKQKTLSGWCEVVHKARVNDTIEPVPEHVWWTSYNQDYIIVSRLSGLWLCGYAGFDESGMIYEKIGLAEEYHITSYIEPIDKKTHIRLQNRSAMGKGGYSEQEIDSAAHMHYYCTKTQTKPEPLAPIPVWRGREVTQQTPTWVDGAYATIDDGECNNLYVWANELDAYHYLGHADDFDLTMHKPVRFKGLLTDRELELSVLPSTKTSHSRQEVTQMAAYVGSGRFSQDLNNARAEQYQHRMAAAYAILT